MQTFKYLAFYALLVVILVLGVLQWHWLIIIPAAFVLSLAYIGVKGNDWRKVMGKSDMNGGIVFLGAFLSQLVVSAILYWAGRAIALLFN